jgi:hypothetical protein
LSRFQGLREGVLQSRFQGLWGKHSKTKRLQTCGAGLCAHSSPHCLDATNSRRPPCPVNAHDGKRTGNVPAGQAPCMAPPYAAPVLALCLSLCVLAVRQLRWVLPCASWSPASAPATPALLDGSRTPRREERGPPRDYDRGPPPDRYSGPPRGPPPDRYLGGGPPRGPPRDFGGDRERMDRDRPPRDFGDRGGDRDRGDRYRGGDRERERGGDRDKRPRDGSPSR